MKQLIERMASGERYERWRKRHWQGWYEDPRQLQLPLEDE
jgi:hypothetical protein